MTENQARPPTRPQETGDRIPGAAPIDARLPVLDVALVRRLIAGQFPDWAGLAVTVVQPQGHDNRSFRLGEEMVVRLPSAERYASQVTKEQRWLPVLARSLPIAIPEPLGLGAPAEGYPFAWSVYRWLPGESPGPGCDLVRLAGDLAAVLRRLQALPSRDGPAAGAQNFFRGGDLRVYDAETRSLADRLALRRDRATARRLWDRALESTWQHAPVWLHGDLSAGNLLLQDGRLSGLIDFGTCGIGDPAADLAVAWGLLDPPARTAFRLALRYDDETWARARGWALWKALVTLGAEIGDADIGAGATEEGATEGAATGEAATGRPTPEDTGSPAAGATACLKQLLDEAAGTAGEAGGEKGG